MSVLIIGQNPSDATFNKSNSTIQTLDRWVSELGITNFWFTNASLTRGNNIKITADLEHIKHISSKYDKVIALGGFASNALKKLGIEHFKLPHPSPRNRQMNDKMFIEQRLNECRKFIHA